MELISRTMYIIDHKNRNRDTVETEIYRHSQRLKQNPLGVTTDLCVRGPTMVHTYLKHCSRMGYILTHTTTKVVPFWHSPRKEQKTGAIVSPTTNRSGLRAKWGDGYPWQSKGSIRNVRTGRNVFSEAAQRPQVKMVVESTMGADISLQPGFRFFFSSCSQLLSCQ